MAASNLSDTCNITFVSDERIYSSESDDDDALVSESDVSETEEEVIEEVNDFFQKM